MPTFQVDNFDSGEAKSVTVGYDELDPATVAMMALNGDDGAYDWLEQNLDQLPSPKSETPHLDALRAQLAAELTKSDDDTLVDTAAYDASIRAAAARGRTKAEPVSEAKDADDDLDWSEVDAWLARNDVTVADVLRAKHEHDHPGEPFRYHRYDGE